MKHNSITGRTVLAALMGTLAFLMALHPSAANAGTLRFPDVTEEMTHADYWVRDQKEILVTSSDIPLMEADPALPDTERKAVLSASSDTAGAEVLGTPSDIARETVPVTPSDIAWAEALNEGFLNCEDCHMTDLRKEVPPYDGTMLQRTLLSKAMKSLSDYLEEGYYNADGMPVPYETLAETLASIAGAETSAEQEVRYGIGRVSDHRRARGQ